MSGGVNKGCHGSGVRSPRGLPMQGPSGLKPVGPRHQLNGPPGTPPWFGQHGTYSQMSPSQSQMQPFQRQPFGRGGRHPRPNGRMGRNMPFQPRQMGPVGPNGPMGYAGPMGPNMPPMPMGMMGCGGFMDPSGPGTWVGPPMSGGSFGPVGSSGNNAGGHHKKWKRNGNDTKFRKTLDSSGSKRSGFVKKESDADYSSEENDGSDSFDSEEDRSNSSTSTVNAQNLNWQGNGYCPQPNGWNYNGPPNHFPYPTAPQNTNGQNYNPVFDPTLNQGYNQNYNQGYSQPHQYFNHGYQGSMNQFNQNASFNVDQESGEDVKPCFQQFNNQYSAQKGDFKMQQKQKKRKVAPVLKMRTHYCDTCDKSFSDEEQLAKHRSEHQVCGLDGCKYTAHPKVVAKHQQMQHFTGLYRRISTLYTPEDIEKWKVDRKKNYPTAKNIEERRARQEEMFSRGERVRVPCNRFPQNQQRNGRPPPRQHPRFNQQRKEDHHPDDQSHHPHPDSSLQDPEVSANAPPKKWKPIFPNVKVVIEESVERRGVKPFPGTGALDPATERSQEESVIVSKPVVKEKEVHALSFLNQYGSSSSDEDTDAECTEASNADVLIASNSAEVEDKNDLPQDVREASVTETAEPSESSLMETSVLSASPQAKSNAENVETTAGGHEQEENTRYCIDDLETGPPTKKTKYDHETSDDETKIHTNEHSESDQSSSNKLEQSRDCANSLVQDEKLDSMSPVHINQGSRTPDNAEEYLHQSPSDETKKVGEKHDDSPHVTNGAETGDSQENKEGFLEGEIEGAKINASKISKNSSESRTHSGLVPSDSNCVTNKASTHRPENPPTSPEEGLLSDDDSGPEEVPIVKTNGCHDNDEGKVDNDDNDNETRSGESGRKRKRQNRQSAKKPKTENGKQPTENVSQRQQSTPFNRQGNQYTRPRMGPPRRPPTLLEKLLSKEICHERNVILQCVRYVVENNFFRHDTKCAEQVTSTPTSR